MKMVNEEGKNILGRILIEINRTFFALEQKHSILFIIYIYDTLPSTKLQLSYSTTG